MHATRRDLLARQAAAAACRSARSPCRIPAAWSVRRDHEAFVDTCAAEGIEAMAFGDLFLEDIRATGRSSSPARVSNALPALGIPTRQLAGRCSTEGSRPASAALISKSCRHPWQAERGRRSFCGTSRRLRSLRENGEMHTIAIAGPMFRQSIPVCVRDVLERDGFAYADIIRSTDIHRFPGCIRLFPPCRINDCKLIFPCADHERAVMRPVSPCVEHSFCVQHGAGHGLLPVRVVTFSPRAYIIHHSPHVNET